MFADNIYCKKTNYDKGDEKLSFLLCEWIIKICNNTKLATSWFLKFATTVVCQNPDD